MARLQDRQDFIERSDPTSKFSSMGSTSNDEMQTQYLEFVARYGQENADYLMEVMSSWQSHYERAAFIDMAMMDVSGFEEEARGTAGQRGWRFEKLAGDLVMFRGLLNGAWEGEPEGNFLVVPPGQTVGLSYDDGIFRCNLE